ncbi:MAG: ParB/RepB/Spo0J family partition protein [Eubacterium sp.]|nr:ParB/RepB/Spo0J family partition protein [Eubacterium sp.]
MAKGGLGRGLNTLIPTGGDSDSDVKKSEKKSSDSKASKKGNSEPKIIEKEVVKEVVKEVPAEQFINISDIEPNRSQPRKTFDEEALNELADSIKKFGVIEPLIVTKAGKKYEIIAGERRWRASRLAGIKHIPVIIRDYSKQEKMEVALIENLQRSDLNPIEEANAYKLLIEEFNLKQEDVADRVSKSRTTVTNSLRLLKLCEKVQEMLIDGRLSTGHVRPLLALTDADLQYETAQLIFDRKLSVRETEKLVKKLLSVDPADYPSVTENDAVSAAYRSIEENLKNILGTKAKISAGSKGKGRIEIEYSSHDELDRIINLLYTVR